MGGLLVGAVLTGVLVLHVFFPYAPFSPVEWALFVLVGVPAWILAGAIFEYAFVTVNEVVEGDRRRRNVGTMGRGRYRCWSSVCC